MTFKVKYKKSGEDVEIEIEVVLPSLDKLLAAQKLGIAPSQIISIKKK
jgi:hypothetical protein